MQVFQIYFSRDQALFLSRFYFSLFLSERMQKSKFPGKDYSNVVLKMSIMVVKWPTFFVFYLVMLTITKTSLVIPRQIIIYGHYQGTKESPEKTQTKIKFDLFIFVLFSFLCYVFSFICQLHFFNTTFHDTTTSGCNAIWTPSNCCNASLAPYLPSIPIQRERERERSRERFLITQAKMQ